MKKFLLALTILAGFVAAAPRAEAGQFTTIYTRHGPQVINKYSGLDASYYNLSHHRNHRHNRSYGYAPHYRSYPVYRSSYRSYPVYRTSYRSYPRYYNTGYNNTGYYGSSCHTSRPRVSVAFGF